MYDQMVIVEKYETFIKYMYPISQSIQRKHGTVRNMFIERLLSVPGLVYSASKSDQVSKLYLVDSALADLRFWLRFLVTIKSLSLHQHEVSLTMLNEIGAILGSWMKKKKGRVG